MRGPPGTHNRQPTDAILRLSAACICGSDLWPYRGIAEVTRPTPMGHEYCGIVRQREFMSSAQAPLLRVPLADGTLVPTTDLPSKELIPSLLATSDVLGTG